MKKTVLLAPLLTAVLSVTPAADASTVAVWFSGGSLVDLPDDDSWTVGFSFKPRSAIVVDGLGFFDYGADGLNNDHPLGLWNEQLNVGIRKTVITTANSTLAGPTINSTGQFRFVDIAPILLVPTYDYTLGGTIFAGQTDAWYSAPMAVTDFYDWDSSLISAVYGGFFNELGDQGDPALQYPYFYTGQRYGAVSIRARLATITDIPANFPNIDIPDRFPGRPVPEPGMLALIGVGIAGFALARQRRVARQLSGSAGSP